MTDKQKRPLPEMQARAESIRAELAPYCTRAEIAGSIRRKAPECSDIELLCVPRFRELPDGLFGSRRVDTLDDFARTRIEAGRWRLREDKNGRVACGPRYKRLLVDGVALDLFSCLPPAQFGLLYMIRTGPAEFSKRLVTPVAHGGWLPNGLMVVDGAIRRGDVIVPTPEERDVFAVIGREWVEPEARQ